MHCFLILFTPEDGNDKYSQADLDNHANNLNPNHDQYYGSRDMDPPSRR